MAFFSSKKTAAETPIPEVMEEHILKLRTGTRPQYLPAGGLPDSSGSSPFSLRQMP